MREPRSRCLAAGVIVGSRPTSTRRHSAIEHKVKAAVDDARILVTGLQFLLGFSYRVVLYDAFDQLPAHARILHVATLLAQLAALALVLSIGPFHRIAEKGESTARVHRYVTRMAGASLAPFALALGCAAFIVFERAYGTRFGAVAGAGVIVTAWALWYGIEFAVGREKISVEEKPDHDGRTPVSKKIDQVLTEARVILPGAQALLGFQFAAYFMEGFEKLPQSSRIAHSVSLLALALAVIMLLAPAAYHRLAAHGNDRPDVDRFAGFFVFAALAPLAVGLSGELYVVVAWVVRSAAVGAAVAVTALLGFLGFWYGWPLLARHRHSA